MLHPQADALYMGMIAVEPGEQGKGWGARLMRAVEAVARHRRLRALRLIAVEEAGNVAYFRRHGFHVVATEGRRAGTWGAREPFTLATMEKVVGQTCKQDGA